jgi:hypothetical protein
MVEAERWRLSINIPAAAGALVTLTPLGQPGGRPDFGVMLRPPGDVGHDYTIRPKPRRIAITDDVAVVTLAVNDDQAAEQARRPAAHGNAVRTATPRPPLEVWVTVSGRRLQRRLQCVPVVDFGGGVSRSTSRRQLQVVTLTPVFDQLRRTKLAVVASRATSTMTMQSVRKRTGDYDSRFRAVNLQDGFEDCSRDEAKWSPIGWSSISTEACLLVGATLFAMMTAGATAGRAVRVAQRGREPPKISWLSATDWPISLWVCARI